MICAFFARVYRMCRVKLPAKCLLQKLNSRND